MNFDEGTNLTNSIKFFSFGCIIAFVANTHITNNVSEASNHIEWTVNVTANFTADIQEVSWTGVWRVHADYFEILCNL